MGCIYLLLALISPRILLVVLWIFTDYVRLAFDHWIWPLLGLIFMPFLTLALVWAYNTEFGIFQIAAIVIGAVMDLGSHNETARRKRRREDA
jgi:quinol-cytochrome oxidoreductase complex cytochrome b subunit